MTEIITKAMISAGMAERVDDIDMYFSVDSACLYSKTGEIIFQMKASVKWGIDVPNELTTKAIAEAKSWAVR